MQITVADADRMATYRAIESQFHAEVEDQEALLAQGRTREAAWHAERQRVLWAVMTQLAPAMAPAPLPVLVALQTAERRTPVTITAAPGREWA